MTALFFVTDLVRSKVTSQIVFSGRESIKFPIS